MSAEHDAKVGPVMLFTSARVAVSSFYQEVIGLAGEPADDATWLEAGNAKVVVHDRGDRQTPKEINTESGFVVWFGVADVQAAYDSAKRLGATASDFFGDYFFARDPDGRYVGIYALEDHAHGHDHEH